MSVSAAILQTRPSFFAPVADRDRADDLFTDYLGFLERRNGGLEGPTRFERRDAAMDDMGTWSGTYHGAIDVERFNRLYAKFDKRAEISEDELALLTFAKMNAGEAYGVEVTSKARAHLMARDEPIYRVERVLNKEEDYHTKILVGATQHFEGLTLTGAWKPAMPLRVLIFCLAKFPPVLFHPVLLGAEIAGVYQFNWMLNRLGTLFPNDPEIRESMERRLIEVLVDEVGHIAYNRIAVGPRGMKVAGAIAAQVLEGNADYTPELIGLGLDKAARGEIARFDLEDLPEEVRRRAFFV